MRMHIVLICFLMKLNEIESLYKNMNSQKNCLGMECLPEQFMNVSEIIHFHGYPCENHLVQTEDGYILSIQRIPHGRTSRRRKNEAVVLQHGLIDSSSTWVINPPHESLGFILADNGYDVWLFNSRGNTYSNKHVNYTTKDKEFWNFSFEELAKYDVVSSIEYVLKTTGFSQVHYVGHSQGTMIGFIEFSRNINLGRKIKSFYALAPVATVGHIKGLLKLYSRFAPVVEILYDLLGIKEYAPNSWLYKFLGDVVCDNHLLEQVCEQPIFLMCGFDTSNLNSTRIPVYITHTPAGTSTKNIVHFVQMLKSGKFQHYDYGWMGNLKKYHQLTAPQYDITGLQTPVALFTGSEDWLADTKDINTYLIPHINHTVFYRRNIKKWNHLDFVWGIDAAQLLYSDILNFLQE